LPELILDEIHVSYGAVEVLRGITMTAEQGRIAAIIGHNGAGKSTVLKAIAGLTPMQSGRVQVGDVDITGRRPHQVLAAGISYMAQGQDLFPRMSVRENVWMGGYLLPKPRRQERLRTCMGLFPALIQKGDARADSLSGGQRQQLKLARSLMTEPDILLLDEPSAGLSPVLVLEAIDQLKSLRDRTGLTMVLVEQNVQQALKIADEVFVLDLGRVAVSGPPAQLASDGVVREIFLGRDTATAP
jgi:branched-chain amino acid transport system ATP-binding protein